MSKDRVDKPWGCYVDYFRSSNVVFKKIMILSGESISYQYHQGREEVWHVTGGVGKLTLDDNEAVMAAGDSVYINKEQKHKMECISEEPLVIYEMQMGDTREDDIVRLEDKYGREDDKLSN